MLASDSGVLDFDQCPAFPGTSFDGSTLCLLDPKVWG